MFLKKIKSKSKMRIWSKIPLLDIDPKKAKTLTWKDMCSSMLTAALFTIAKTWKQPKCLSVDEWIKKVWYTHMHTQNRLFSHKKNKILLYVTTWMDLKNFFMLSEISQWMTNAIWSLLYVEFKTQITLRPTSYMKRIDWWLPKEGGGG